ncbi:MAG: SUMF1/EgtB/PvdO family nonheme iron enzyme [Anaerolineae bacterium]|nr:SUMF1/EgtB/PvdO family nonheme iron enzyme [Anaerolineae bacterium]
MRCCLYSPRPRGGGGRVGSRHRVVRGGAFNNDTRNVRCAYRNNDNPDNRNRNQGFRVVVAHALAGVMRRRKCGAMKIAPPRHKNSAIRSRPRRSVRRGQI